MKLGYDPNRKCIKCHKIQDYIFYCDECSGTFCNDCLISEKTDCTFCKECSYISVGNRCEKCGRLNHLSAAKKITKCPICSSSKLKDVSSKINGLTNEFHEVVSLIGKSINSIKEFSDKYSEITGKAKQLRKEQFGLYPNIENGLLRVQNKFFEITQRASELLDKIYQQVIQDSRLLNFNQNITITQLPGIEKTFKLIKTHANSYTNLINDFLGEPKKELLLIEEKISELSNYSLFFDKINEKFELEMAELKIAVFPNVKMSFPHDKRKKKGILYITNKRLYFLPKSRFLFKFFDKIHQISISMIKDVETKVGKLSGHNLIINIPEKKEIIIKSNEKEIERINFIFGILFNDNEGYIINDPYMMEEFRNNLTYGNLQEKIDGRIKDLKQIPFSKIAPNPRFQPRDQMLVSQIDSEQVKGLKIELKAARDTLQELIKAFNERTITPEVYFSRREKTQQRIMALEEELKEVQKAQLGYRNLTDLLNNYTPLYDNEQPTR